MAKTFVPLYDNILVRPIEIKQGSLLIPDSAKGAPTHGEIVAVGVGYRTETGIQPLVLKVKDRITFRKGDGLAVTVGREQLLVMKESQALGTVHGE